MKRQQLAVSRPNIMLILASTLTGITILILLIPGAAAQSPQGTPLSCSDSPFGRVVELGKEREIFVSFRGSPDFRGTSNGLNASLNNLGEPQQPGNIQLIEEGLFANDAQHRYNISWLAATAADLNGDGKVEFVQGFTDAIGRTQFVVHGNGNGWNDDTDWSWSDGYGWVVTTVTTESNYIERTMAAGDVLGRDNGSQQIVTAARGNNALRVSIREGAANGTLNEVAAWSSNAENRDQATLIDIGVGNLDNDGYLDIVVAFRQENTNYVQLVYLEYDPTYNQGSGSNLSFRLRTRAFITTEIFPTPIDLQIELADLNGDSQDSVILAHSTSQTQTPGISPTLHLYTFDFNTRTGALARSNLQWVEDANASTFVMATGDIDGIAAGNGNRRQEIVLGYNSSGVGNGNFAGLNIKTIRLINLNTSSPQLATTDHWWNNQNGRNWVRYLALAVDDLDRDNRDDVVAAFTDSTSNFGFQMIYLQQGFNSQGQAIGLQLKGSRRSDPAFNSDPQIVMGDWDNNSLRGVAGGSCASVTEYTVTAVGFVPPFWQHIQGDQSEKGGSIGRSVSQSFGVENSLTYERSHTVSAYVGVGVEVTGFSASARATGAREYATSNTRATETVTATIRTLGHSWGNDAVVYEPAQYKCYSYQMSNGTDPLPVTDASVRFCEYIPFSNSLPLTAEELDSWDRNNSSETEWIPVVRDWSSLALFRGTYTDQSSNAGAAALAVDSQIVAGSFISGTVAQTNLQANPWWQVDLGSVQTIDKIRIWSPGHHTNLHIFVSNNDFRTMSGHTDPANLIGVPGVFHYTLADIGVGLTTGDPIGPVTTLLTHVNDQPVRGRYIRVQLAGTDMLKLAEVQVFGPNHLEPDRYPLDLRDTDPNDGFFEVLLYNPYHTTNNDTYQWVKTRGRLLWDGRDYDIGILVGRGNAKTEWSLTTSQEETQIQREQLSNVTHIGYEIDIEAGLIVNLQAGFGEEFSAGIASETVQSTSWSENFEMGGLIQGFPNEYDGQSMNWVQACRYRFHPYYYELVEESSVGYQHRFPILDYLVPDDNNEWDLQRTDNLNACRNGNQTANTPQTTVDNFTTSTGQTSTFNVLANDQGNNLEVTSVGPAQNGTTTHTTRTITYTPRSGFIGTDQFDYTISDGTNSASGTVTVTVERIYLYVPVVSR